MLLRADHTGYRESVRLTDSHRHKFSDAMAEYVYSDMDSWGDRGEGDSEFPGGWFAPVGSKRILRGDDRGFVWLEKFGNEYERDLVYNALRDWYYGWSDEESAEEDEPAHQTYVDQLAAYVSYVYQCDADATTPYAFDQWVAFGGAS